MKKLWLVYLLLLLGVCTATGQNVFPAAKTNDVFLNVGGRLGEALGYGWGQVERVDHINYRWITGLEADIFFDLPAAVDTELWLYAAPLYFPGQQQVIGVYINGKFVEYGERAGVETPYNKTLRSL